jgi:hypothetical protein
MDDPVVNSGIFTLVPRTFENSTIDCDCMR